MKIVGLVCTMSPGPRPTAIPSGILIHPDVWPQTWDNAIEQHTQTDKSNINSLGNQVVAASQNSVVGFSSSVVDKYACNSVLA